jgi:hypothetical protein
MKSDLPVLALSALLVLFSAGPLRAEPASHRWLSAPLKIETPHSYFTDLQDGARIETPYLVRFGLAGIGLAPIPQEVPNTGHHHLLINRDLPLEFKKALPFNEQYIHFGKGQMEGVLDLPPGDYTLRLLMADHAHIPLFVYSNPIRVTVTQRRSGIDPKTLTSPGVELLSPRAAEVLRAPFPVRFHASALAVGHEAVTQGKTGHFQLRLQPRGQPEELIDFRNGLTEAWLAPPPGTYQMQLQLVTNAAPQEVLATSPAISVRVAPAAPPSAPAKP